jgi:hypothetical protein
MRAGAARPAGRPDALAPADQRTVERSHGRAADRRDRCFTAGAGRRVVRLRAVRKYWRADEQPGRPVQRGIPARARGRDGDGRNLGRDCPGPHPRRHAGRLVGMARDAARVRRRMSGARMGRGRDPAPHGDAADAELPDRHQIAAGPAALEPATADVGRGRIPVVLRLQPRLGRAVAGPGQTTDRPILGPNRRVFAGRLAGRGCHPRGRRGCRSLRSPHRHPVRAGRGRGRHPHHDRQPAACPRAARRAGRLRRRAVLGTGREPIHRARDRPRTTGPVQRRLHGRVLHGRHRRHRGWRQPDRCRRLGRNRAHRHGGPHRRRRHGPSLRSDLSGRRGRSGDRRGRRGCAR